MHYSGVWDARAVELHPDWAIKDPAGNPSTTITSVFGPYVDKLLNGAIDSKSTFDRHLQKILKTLNMSVEDFMLFHSPVEKKESAVFSENAPEEHEMSTTASKQYDLLLDIIDLCTIYY